MEEGINEEHREERVREMAIKAIKTTYDAVPFKDTFLDNLIGYLSTDALVGFLVDELGLGELLEGEKQAVEEWYYDYVD